MKRITASSVIVKVSVSEGDLSLLEEAVAKARPSDDWRASTSAMTKATAREALAAVKASGELPYFDWTVLMGELARLAVQSPKREDILHAWVRLREAIQKNEDVKKLLDVVDATEAAGRDVEKARRALAAAQAELKRREREAEILADPDPEFEGMTREEGDEHRRQAAIAAEEAELRSEAVQG